MIYIYSIGNIQFEILDRLVKPLNQKFNQPISIGGNILLTNNTWNPLRQQHNADLIMDKIPEPLAKDKHLAIMDLDIYAFGLNYIFGEADSRSGKALVSLKRLKPEFYGLSPDLQQFQERTLIETVHELGHTYNLRHCPNIRCVMHFSNSIENTDIKGDSFCPACLLRLENELTL